MIVRFWVFAMLVVLPVACSGRDSVPGTTPMEATGETKSLQSGPNLFVASSGGRNGRNPPPKGGVSVFGLEHGKLLQKISDGVDHPTAVALSPAGNLFVANQEPGRTSSGQYSGSVTVYAPGRGVPQRILQQTEYPDALAFDSSGNVYVANKWGPGIGGSCQIGTVAVYAPGQIYPTRILGDVYNAINLPFALVTDAAGNLYVANDPSAVGSSACGDSITVFGPGQSAPFATITDGVFYPRALALAPGVLYVANGPPHGVVHLPYGSVTVYALGSGTLLRTITKGINSPYSLAIDTSGNLYVANVNGHNVSMYAPGGLVPTRTITKGATSPRALAFSAGGDLYVANVYENTVSIYDPGSDIPRLTIDVPYKDPASIVIGR